jgi:hypothetical protein
MGQTPFWCATYSEEHQTMWVGKSDRSTKALVYSTSRGLKLLICDGGNHLRSYFTSDPATFHWQAYLVPTVYTVPEIARFITYFTELVDLGPQPTRDIEEIQVKTKAGETVPLKIIRRHGVRSQRIARLLVESGLYARAGSPAWLTRKHARVIPLNEFVQGSSRSPELWARSYITHRIKAGCSAATSAKCFYPLRGPDAYWIWYRLGKNLYPKIDFDQCLARFLDKKATTPKSMYKSRNVPIWRFFRMNFGSTIIDHITSKVVAFQTFLYDDNPLGYHK